MLPPNLATHLLESGELLEEHGQHGLVGALWQVLHKQDLVGHVGRSGVLHLRARDEWEGAQFRECEVLSRVWLG